MDIKSFAGMNVLVLSPTPTYPVDFGNRKRVFSVCKELQDEGASVHFLYYPSESDWRESMPDDDIFELQRQWASFTMVPPSKELHAWPEGEDHLIDEWWDPSIENTLKWMFKAKKFDAFIVNYTWLSKALDFAPEYVVKVLDTHDKFSNRRELLESNGIGKEFYHTTEEQELIALDRADLVWAIKDQEKDFFKSLTRKPKIETLIHCDHDQYTFDTSKVEKLEYIRVGIFGARNNINVVNTRNFLEEALPACREALAPIKFVLGGTMCHDLEYEDSEWIENIGYVKDVAEFYNQVDLVVIPMVFSSGLKIKVAEAFARSVPVLCHEHASEGYPIVTGDHALKSIDSLVDRLMDLAFDPGQLDWLASMSQKAYERCHYEFDSTLESLSKQIRRNSVVSMAVIRAEDLTANNLRCIRIRELFDFLPYASKSVLLVVGQEVDHRITNVLRDKSSVYFIDEESANSYIKFWSPDLLWLMAGMTDLKVPSNCKVYVDELVDGDEISNISIEKKMLVTPNAFRGNNYSGYESVVTHPIFNWRLAKKALPVFRKYHHGGKIVVFNDGSRTIDRAIKFIKKAYREDAVVELVLDSLNIPTRGGVYDIREVVNDISLLPKHISLFTYADDAKIPAWLKEVILRSDCHYLDFMRCSSVLDVVKRLDEALVQSNPRSQENDVFGNDAGWSYLWDLITKDVRNNKELKVMLD